MRILHTCFTYWPCSDGVAIAMQRISEGLAALGHDVTVATAFSAERAGATEHEGVRIREFRVSGNEVDGYIGDVDGFTRFVREFDADVMLNYAAQICTTDLVFPVLGELGGAKVIVPCGYSALRDPRYREYFSRLPERLARYDRAIYMSRHYQDSAFSDEHGLSNAVLIPNGASLSEFDELRSGFREAYGITESRLFICVANIMDLKGQREVHEAFISSGVTDAALVFIGSEVSRFVTGAMRTAPGPFYTLRRRLNILRHELLEAKLCPSRNQRYDLASGPGTRSFVLAGVPRESVLAAYAEADLFLFASKVECAPLVIHETMAAGTPWVSFPVGNVPELEGGVVVHGVAEMAEEIRHLTDDAAERTRLGSLGRTAWRARYTWESVVQQYAALYRELVESA